MKRHAVVSAVLVLVALSAAVGACALGVDRGNPNPGLLPLNAKVGGLSYADWADEWLSLQFSVPAPECPVLDGAASEQTPDPVFMLSVVGYVPGATNMGECWVTVRRGQALFLPLTNAAAFVADDCLNSDGTCAEGLSGEDLASYLRECADTCMSHTTDLYATVDGRELQDLFAYRTVSSQPFTACYPEDSQFAGAAGPGGTVGTDAGLMPVVVGDGWSLLLSPLSPGEHVISYGASNSALDGTAGVIYHITVE